MRWFKHVTTSQYDEKLSRLLDEFGAEGYGVYWMILEKIGAQLDEKSKTFLTLSAKTWAKSCRISVKKFQNLIGFCEKINLFCLKTESRYLTIDCPKMLEFRDEWTERKTKSASKKPEKLPSDSRVTPDKLNHELDPDPELDKKLYKKISNAHEDGSGTEPEFLKLRALVGSQKRGSVALGRLAWNRAMDRGRLPVEIIAGYQAYKNFPQSKKGFDLGLVRFLDEEAWLENILAPTAYATKTCDFCKNEITLLQNSTSGKHSTCYDEWRRLN